jgi:UDPglucose 6-dehydrogenase
MHLYCVQKVRRKLRTLNGKRIGILGLTFKPHTDDVRETQAVTIIEELIALGSEIRVHDPQGMASFRKLHSHLKVHFCESPEDVAQRAEAIILLTHWPVYNELNWADMRERMRFPYLLDTRNFLHRTMLRDLGFIYEGMGK